MKHKLVRSLLGSVAALLFVAGLVAAKTTTVHILYKVDLQSGSMLKPGTYNVALLDSSKSPELAFYQNHKQVAESAVKLVSQTRKISETEIHYNAANNAHVLTEIDLRGWNQKVMFPASITQ
jgi:hypothetical protein